MDDVIVRLDDADAEAWFEYAGYKARNLTVPLRQAADILLASVMRAFLTEGRSTGRQWKRLSESRIRERGGSSHPILRWEDDLFDAATHPRAAHVRHVGAHGARLLYSVDVDYAAAHQFGGYQSVNLETGEVSEHPPPRPFVVVTRRMQQAWQQQVVEWLDDLKSRNARRADRPLALPFIPGLEELIA